LHLSKENNNGGTPVSALLLILSIIVHGLTRSSDLELYS